MLRPSTCIIEPLSVVETNVLVAYANNAVPNREPREPRPGGVPYQPSPAWALAAQQLLSRGLLQRTKEGIILTPEGLAAVLDPAPVELFRVVAKDIIRMATPPASKLVTPPEKDVTVLKLVVGPFALSVGLL